MGTPQVSIPIWAPKDAPMTRDARITRRDILTAADELFYGEGLRSVSVDEIAAKAGITKKTLYYHFRSKDELIAAYLDARDRPTLERFQQWAGDEGTVTERLERMFRRLGRCAKSPTWKGCGFVRATGELANIPGHPAIRIARAHKANFEKWLSDSLAAEGHRDCEDLARGLMVIIDGAVTQMLLHRDPRYARAASRAACALLNSDRAPVMAHASSNVGRHTNQIKRLDRPGDW
jgi:AcrR family transcriptional regulator